MRVKDLLGKDWDIECMGCAVSDGSMAVPGGLVQSTRYFCVHQDPLIPIEGFMVIASRCHIRSILEMEDVEYDEFSRLVRDVHRAIKEATGIEHLTLVQEESSTHFHTWFFPWTGNIIETYGKPSLSKIRKIMSDYRTHLIDGTEWHKLEQSITRIRERLAAC